ncbi:MAG: hypothetical protein QNJ60_12775 [Xenococcaceae cyanobacterium MO_188.B19]|nr:hypothetical protein [Xenococcaceae cyanobacterium MO_188.B19]
MIESVTLEKVLNLAKKLSPMDRIRLIEQITPQIKRDLLITAPQPYQSLKGICHEEAQDITEISK